MFSPIFGKYIERIGSRNLFLLGTLIAGIGNIAFGFLQWVDQTYPFLTLSLIIRIISAMGEAAFFTAVYPLTVDVSSSILPSSFIRYSKARRLITISLFRRQVRNTGQNP